MGDEPQLRLYLLGTPRVELRGAPVEIKRRKALALLSYLAVSGQQQPRDRLAALFWPELNPSQARKALRRDLSELNLTLNDEWLVADRERVGLRDGAWVDVAEFRRALADAATDAHQLIAAVSLYRDHFLTGFDLLDCPEFAEWHFFEAESLRQNLASALERLVNLLSDQGESEPAGAYARRWLALNPLHEPAHRRLMQLYAQMGQQAAALRQYQVCVETLKAELGIPPAAETTALYDDIRAGRVRREAIPDPRLVTRSRHNLPIQTTSFVGREIELDDIRRLLLDEPNCRLLTLVGPGGIGKTRLALAAAAQTLDAFPDGACFVSLAPVGEVAYIVPAIAEALRFAFQGGADPEMQLLDYLQHKQLLLVADNFEHLLDGVHVLADILRHAPNVSILVTARERLNLQEEWVYEVRGLSFPDASDESSMATMSYSAVQLFLQRARQIDASFAASPTEMRDILRICRVVQGMPLGLELAAPWIRSLSCREIADEIARSPEVLTTTLRNVPERHRSLKVVFGQTWFRLSDAEQDVLQRLSVFRGGCTREAAEQVTRATLAVLSSLVDKALLRRTNTGRYQLHELIRQFAEMQLQSDANAAEQARKCHRDYFVAFLEARTAGVKGGRQRETTAEIKADIDNVRLVWQRAVANRDTEAIARVAECLFVFYLYSSGHYEGQSAFEQATAALQQPIDGAGSSDELTGLDKQESLVAFLLAAQGYFLGRTRDAVSGQRVVEQALALLRRSERLDPHIQGFALLWLAWMFLLQGKPKEAQESIAPALAILTETGDHWAEGWALILWANALSEARPLAADDIYQRGLVVCQHSGDMNMMGYTSQMRSIAQMGLGRYAQAKQGIDEAVQAFEEMGNRLGLGYCLQRQGELAVYLGAYAHAIDVCQQAVAIFDEVRTEKNVITTQIILGRAYWMKGDHDQADQLFLHCLEALMARNEEWGVAHCVLGLGCLAAARGDVIRAEEYLCEALARYRQQGLQVRVADASRYLGHLLVASGEHRHREAGQYYRHALEIAEEHGLAPIALDVIVGVSQLAIHAGDVGRALELLTLVRRHEASTFETREKAKRLLAAVPKPSAPMEERVPELWTTVMAELSLIVDD